MATGPTDPLAPGSIVGRYVVLDVLGAGATGVVYAADDPELARQVALKLLRPRAAARQGVRAARFRMLREAQAMARLTHRNVVAVYDVGDDGEHLYIAMELVRGANLRRWLDGRARPWREVVPVLLAAGRGLAAAHAHGLVHRDFKPENVLIGNATDRPDDRRVCVSDFGLARPDPSSAAIDDGDAGHSGVLDVTITVDGDALGTPAYMAPEQHRGAPADARVDQYAFALVLFEALYGVRPFTGDDPDAILSAKLGPPIEPRALAEDGARRWPVPAWLRAAIRRALLRDPAQRWPSMARGWAGAGPAPRWRPRLSRRSCWPRESAPIGRRATEPGARPRGGTSRRAQRSSMRSRVPASPRARPSARGRSRASKARRPAGRRCIASSARRPGCAASNRRSCSTRA